MTPEMLLLLLLLLFVIIFSYFNVGILFIIVIVNYARFSDHSLDNIIIINIQVCIHFIKTTQMGD